MLYDRALGAPMTNQDNGKDVELPAIPVFHDGFGFFVLDSMHSEAGIRRSGVIKSSANGDFASSMTEAVWGIETLSIPSRSSLIGGP